MGSHRNLDGTSRPDFSVGVEQEHGVRVLGDGQVGLYDPINGEQPMSAFLGGSSDIEKLIITSEGGLVYDEDGEFILKVAT